MLRIEPTIDNNNPENNSITVYNGKRLCYTANATQIWDDRKKRYSEIGCVEWMKSAHNILKRRGPKHLRYLLTGKKVNGTAESI